MERTNDQMFADFAKENGEVAFEGKNYALIRQAELTNRVFFGWWGEAEIGEEYAAEYSAPAMGEDGEEYVLTWRFEVVKGEEPEADCLDWDNVDSVIPA